MNTDIIAANEMPTMAMATTVPATPADIVLYAMKNGGSIEQIRDFMQLQREWEADQARKAYVADMAEFKKNPPQIVKDKLVGFENKDGSFTGYKHATLGNVTSAIVEGLATNGFSHRWDTKQEGPSIVVTCILTHKLGHSESTVLSSPRDDSGKKNAIQAMASAITYLQRYTLLAATGLATHDQEDDDGRSAGEEFSADKWISEAATAADLKALETVWNTGSVLFPDRGMEYAKFKNVVNDRKKALQPIAAAGTSSRLAAIVGAEPAAQEGGAA